MNIPKVSYIIGICSAGLYLVIENYYKKLFSNKDFYARENIGFILAYCHFMKLLSTQNIQAVSRFISTEITPDHSYDEQSDKNILSAAEFYSRCFYDMFTTKTWSLPDKIVYNLLRPNSWNDFSNSIPIAELNFIEITEIWVKIGDFISSQFNPRISEILKLETENAK